MRSLLTKRLRANSIGICFNWAKIGLDLVLLRKKGVLSSSCSLELHLGRTQKVAIRSTSIHFAEIIGSKIPVHLIVKFVENAMTGGSGIVKFVTFARTAYHCHTKGVEAFHNPMRTRRGIWVSTRLIPKAGRLDILEILMGAGVEFLDQQTALHLAATK
jgi:hypothetical protein